MTPSWSPAWLFIGALLVLFIVGVAFSYRRRSYYEQFRGRTMTVHGPPVTPELQQLFSAYGQSQVEGIVQLRDGLQVGYANGVQLTFVPVHTGGKVGGVRE